MFVASNLKFSYTNSSQFTFALYFAENRVTVMLSDVAIIIHFKDFQIACLCLVDIMSEEGTQMQ